jgi:hypothetical protein
MSTLLPTLFVYQAKYVHTGAEIISLMMGAVVAIVLIYILFDYTYYLFHIKEIEDISVEKLKLSSAQNLSGIYDYKEVFPHHSLSKAPPSKILSGRFEPTLTNIYDKHLSAHYSVNITKQLQPVSSRLSPRPDDKIDNSKINHYSYSYCSKTLSLQMERMSADERGKSLSIVDQFEICSLKYPHHVAVVSEEGDTVDYETLSTLSGRVQQLVYHVITRDKADSSDCDSTTPLVSLMLDRHVSFLSAMLGVPGMHAGRRSLHAGGSRLPARATAVHLLALALPAAHHRRCLSRLRRGAGTW